MKKISPYALAALAGFTLIAAGQENPGTVYRDAATHTSLVTEFQKVSANDPIRKMEISEGADPSKANTPQNLIESSDLISFQGLTTLVPKRAILQIPETYRSRINNHTPGNRVVGWLEFFALNRGWITTVEISRAQAGGNEPLAEALSEQLSKSRNMIVAVMETGPISYMPYRGDDSEKQSTTSN